MLFLLVAFAVVTPASEIARIQTHLSTVEVELRAADLSPLSESQRARRTALIDELARYRQQGRFPRNLSAEVQTPFFIDDRGVRCAMAHLIETHGGAALVARVAATANNAYVRELSLDPALQAWLRLNGLTVAEAARIQPSYPKMPGQRCDALSRCSDSTCEPALDEPRLAFCSPTCEPGGTPCPIGVENIAMECQLRGDRHLCVYPEPTPGIVGWPCDPNASSNVCVDLCVSVGDEGQGECASACSNSQACPTGYACEPLRDGAGGDYLRSCRRIEEGGCSAGGSTGLVSVLLWLPALLRTASRSRPSRRRRSG